MTTNHALDMMTDGQRCPFWVESRDERCGSRELVNGRWCKRHTTVMHRRAAKLAEQANTRRRADDERRAAHLPALRAELARIEAEMARCDPQPPTDDMAAYGGVGSTTAARYWNRLRADANVIRLAELAKRRDALIADIETAQASAARITRPQGARP